MRRLLSLVEIVVVNDLGAADVEEARAVDGAAAFEAGVDVCTVGVSRFSDPIKWDVRS